MELIAFISLVSLPVGNEIENMLSLAFPCFWIFDRKVIEVESGVFWVKSISSAIELLPKISH